MYTHLGRARWGQCSASENRATKSGMPWHDRTTIARHADAIHASGVETISAGNHDAMERMARVTGLEPATSGVTGRRSNQLSYTRLRSVRRGN